MLTFPSHCKRRSSSSLLIVSSLALCPWQRRHVAACQAAPSLTSKQLSHASKGIERCSRKLCSCSAPKRPELLARIQTAIARGDGRALERAAHSLKGTVMSWAQTAGGAALRLEVMGRGNDLTQALMACTELEREVAQLERALAVFRGEQVA